MDSVSIMAFQSPVQCKVKHETATLVKNVRNREVKPHLTLTYFKPTIARANCRKARGKNAVYASNYDTDLKDLNDLKINMLSPWTRKRTKIVLRLQ